MEGGGKKSNVKQKKEGAEASTALRSPIGKRTFCLIDKR